MTIDVPAEIFAKCFFERICDKRAVHSNVMFKAVLAKEIKKLLESRDLADADAARGGDIVLNESTFADVGPDAAGDVIGGDSGEGHRTGGDFAFYSAEGFILAERCAEDIEI